VRLSNKGKDRDIEEDLRENARKVAAAASGVDIDAGMDCHRPPRG
jgi:hypothetical protein